MYICKTNFKCLSSARGEPQLLFKEGDVYTGPCAKEFLAEGFIFEKKDAKKDQETAQAAPPKAKRSAPKASVAQAS